MGMRGGGKAGRFCTVPMRIATEDACVRMYVLVTQSYLTLCDPWNVAGQAPLFMGFSRQEYWRG